MRRGYQVMSLKVGDQLNRLLVADFELGLQHEGRGIAEAGDERERAAIKRVVYTQLIAFDYLIEEILFRL